MGQAASWPAGQPTVQPGNQAILGQPASSQQTGGLVCQPGGEPAGYQPEGRQAAIQSYNRPLPRSHF